MYGNQREFSELIGKTFASVVNVDHKELVFTTLDGEIYKLYHEQDCCENVTIDDINGDLIDLVGSPILKASEDSSTDNPEGVPIPEWQDSFTWTFYNITTMKGHVAIRWYGASNGYYSESVTFACMTEN